MALDTTTQQILSIIQSKQPGAELGDFIRYGFKKGKQIYLHKPTGRRFVATEALPHRRIPPQQVGAAIGMYFDGESYRDIQRRMQELYGFKPSSATLYEWVRDYSRRAKRFTDTFKAHTGSVWVADEMMVRIDGKNTWLWSVMDRETRYLLSVHISPTRTIHDARVLFSRAAQRASTPPTHIITDGLRAYQDGIERVFGAETKHVISEGIRSPEIHNNLAERLNGTIRERTKVMRGMETYQSAKVVMDGFVTHYNHMKPHHALGGRVPAEAARLSIVFQDWQDVARLNDERIETFKREIVRDRSLEVRPLRDRIFGRRRGPF